LKITNKIVHLVMVMAVSLLLTSVYPYALAENWLELLGIIEPHAGASMATSSVGGNVPDNEIHAFYYLPSTSDSDPFVEVGGVAHRNALVFKAGTWNLPAVQPNGGAGPVAPAVNGTRELSVFFNLQKNYTELTGTASLTDFVLRSNGGRAAQIDFYADGANAPILTVTVDSLAVPFQLNVTNVRLLRIKYSYDPDTSPRNEVALTELMIDDSLPAQQAVAAAPREGGGSLPASTRNETIRTGLPFWPASVLGGLGMMMLAACLFIGRRETKQ